ncbi:MAG: hypothetical protein U1E53_01765 [Dongiaceae bacterium]
MLGAEGPRIVEGPFAGNPVFLAALAGLQPGWPVIASTDASGTSAGAALLAAWPPDTASREGEEPHRWRCRIRESSLLEPGCSALPADRS